MTDVPASDTGSPGSSRSTPAGNEPGSRPTVGDERGLNAAAEPGSRAPGDEPGASGDQEATARDETAASMTAASASSGRWLAVDGRVVAPLDVADSVFRRGRGLLGRAGYDRAMWFPRTSSVHTLGMRFAIDVAFLDRDLHVVGSCRMVPWRVGRPRRCRSLVEAAAGSFDTWGLHTGSQVEIRSQP